MAKEALVIKGSNHEVIVEEGEAYLIKPRGRRHIGTYVDLKISHANSPEEAATLFVRSFVNPQLGLLRRAVQLMNINSPFTNTEALETPPIQALRIRGPISSRMIPVIRKAA